jgi:hypothetical protein
MQSFLKGLQEQKALHAPGMKSIATSFGKCGSAGVTQEQAWDGWQEARHSHLSWGAFDQVQSWV